MKNVMKKTVALDLIMILLAAAIIVTQIPIHAQDIPGEWEVILNFTEPDGATTNAYFGEAPDANDGPPVDAYDMMMPPPPPMPPYLRAWFDDGLPVPYDDLWADYRHYPDTSKIWDLSVQWVPDDYTSPTDITISWDVNDIDASEYNDVVLYDVIDGTIVVDMFADTQYTFNASAMVPKVFQIICGTSTNQPPYMPSNPSPTDGQTGVGTSPTLGVDVSDPDGDSMGVHFYNADGDTLIGTASGIASGGRTEVTWPSLAYSTQYRWYTVADDREYQTQSETWSFTTKGDPGGGDPGGGDPGGGDPGDNKLPIADADGPYTGFVGIPVIFNGSGSNDPDGYITNYTWHFGDGTEGYGEITNHTYIEIGNYTVTILVTDDGGKKSSNLTYAIITGVANNPPSMPIVTGSIAGQKNIIHNYTAVSTDPDNDMIRYFFDWDDSTNTTSDFLASGTVYNTSHIWTDSGVYTIAVSAEDENSAMSDTTEMMVLIDVEVEFIDDVINGYLIDYGKDGAYNVFYNNITGNETIVERQNNGSYLIDIDGDDDWDYIYDPAAGLTIYQNEEQQKEKQKSTPGFELIIVVCTIAVFLFWNRKRRDVY